MKNEQWQSVNANKIEDLTCSLNSKEFELKSLDVSSLDYLAKSVKLSNSIFYLKMDLESLMNKDVYDFRQEQLWKDTAPGCFK